MSRGMYSSFRIQLVVMWLVSRILALAAGARRNSWCVAVAMTHTNTRSFPSEAQAYRGWHNSFMAVGHSRASRPENRGDIKVKEQCIRQTILLNWALWRPLVHVVDHKNLQGLIQCCTKQVVLFFVMNTWEHAFWHFIRSKVHYIYIFIQYIWIWYLHWFIMQIKCCVNEYDSIYRNSYIINHYKFMIVFTSKS